MDDDSERGSERDDRTDAAPSTSDAGEAADGAGEPSDGARESGPRSDARSDESEGDDAEGAGAETEGDQGERGDRNADVDGEVDPEDDGIEPEDSGIQPGDDGAEQGDDGSTEGGDSGDDEDREGGEDPVEEAPDSPAEPLEATVPDEAETDEPGADEPATDADARFDADELEPGDAEAVPDESGVPDGVQAGGGSPDGGTVSVDHPDNLAGPTAIERKTGPDSDEEMPLADHIEEMVTRLFVVIAVAGVMSLFVLPFGEEIINFLWRSVLPGGDLTRPRVYQPLALVMTQLKVASLAGLIVALPVLVYETYAFMRPGLYPHERRYYLASVPMSLVLALVGVTFAYFVVLPAIFTYFLYYSEGVTVIAFSLTHTFNLILLLMGYLALVFQIPLFIMLAIMMGLTTRRWLEQRRLYFWGGFVGVAFLFSPDPTGMAPIIVGATMIGLFEGTLLLLRWTGR